MAMKSAGAPNMPLLRQLCLASGLNEELKWGQACYDFRWRQRGLDPWLQGVLRLAFHEGALLKDPKGILVQQTKNVQAARQIRFLLQISTGRKRRSKPISGRPSRSRHPASRWQ